MRNGSENPVQPAGGAVLLSCLRGVIKGKAPTTNLLHNQLMSDEPP